MLYARNICRVAAPLARSYATAPAANASKALPVQLHGIEGRYASALYAAAVKKDQLDAIEKDLATVSSILQKDAKLKFALESPMVNKHDKTTLAAGAFKGVGAITSNFFALLAENGRLDHTDKVLASFKQLLSAYRREVSVTVISAKELDASTAKKLSQVLSKSSLIEKDSKIVVSNKVDPNILGGLIIDLGDRTIDLSVASKINKLNRLLTEAI
ncbi:ATP synthase F0 subcomplex subunit OSCP atp5 [Thoreauomyces humboldtii]|nr:ATP synthase F0 subcomplex subunit OSCP atp5 [Thoreauomyces humboldtii]